MLACYRYIESNPVRAGMVRHPRDCRWSSFHANGDGKQDAMVVPHEQYLGLARNEQARREAYRALFKAHLDPEVIERIRSATLTLLGRARKVTSPGAAPPGPSQGEIEKNNSGER